MSCISERFNLVLYRSAWLNKAIETAFVYIDILERLQNTPQFFKLCLLNIMDTMY